MSTVSEVRTWSLERCTDELGAAGHYSCHTDVSEAREAVVAMLEEYGKVMPRKERIAAIVTRQSHRIADLFSAGREESALILATRLIDRIDSSYDGAGMREIVFEIAPGAFNGSPNWSRELWPRWRCEYEGVSVTIRARSQRQAQFEAAQILMDLTAIDAHRVRDDQEIVPSYI